MPAWIIAFVLWVAILNYVDPGAGAAFTSGLIAWGGIFFFLLLVSMVRFFSPVRTSRADPPNLYAGLRTYRVNTMTGRVHSVGRDAFQDTNVNVSTYGAGTSTYGSTPRVTVTTKTTTIDRFSLTNASGGERSFQIPNTLLALGAGQLVTVAWPVPRGGSDGYAFLVVNHSTGDNTWVKDRVLRLVCGGSYNWPLLWAVVSGALFMGGSVAAALKSQSNGLHMAPTDNPIFDLGLAAVVLSVVVIAIVPQVQAAMLRGRGSRGLRAAIDSLARSEMTSAGPVELHAQPPSAVPTPPPARPAEGAVPPPPPAQAQESAWRPDPLSRHEYRFWDGARWTAHVSDSGRTSTDPV